MSAQPPFLQGPYLPGLNKWDVGDAVAEVLSVQARAVGL